MGHLATMDATGKQNMNGPMDEAIETRFGMVTIQRENPILFPSGPLGMPDKQNFCLSAFPSVKMQRFKLLQSLDDMKLSFITLPLELHNPILNSDDVAAACKDVDISLSNLALMVIVSVHRSPSGIKLSVNARAPLLVDTANRLAIQYVFPSEKYLVQHFITT